MKKKDKKTVLFSGPVKNNNQTINPPESDTSDEIPEYNDYYLTVSVRFRTAKIVCVFALCIFILSSMLIFGESMTYENARYIMRDLGQILSEDSSEPASQITFDVDGEMDYAVFRGSLVVCGVSGVDIFSPSGTKKLTDNTSFISPVAVTSEKYCIVYSLGAYNLSIYNTVARVYDMKFEFPIYDVAVSDDGYIAVMTQSNEYKCVVYMYNSDFKQIGTYNKVNYPCAVDICDKTNDLSIATFGTHNGKYITKIDSYALNSNEPVYSVDIEGRMPFDISVMLEGNLAILTQDSLVFLTNEGDTVAHARFDGTLTDYQFSENSVSLLVNNGISRIHSYDCNGSMIHTFDAENAIDIHYTDTVVLARSNSSLTAIPTSVGEPYSIELDHGARRLISHDGYLYVCYPDKITSISLK